MIGANIKALEADGSLRFVGHCQEMITWSERGEVVGGSTKETPRLVRKRRSIEDGVRAWIREWGARNAMWPGRKEGSMARYVWNGGSMVR